MVILNKDTGLWLDEVGLASPLCDFHPTDVNQTLSVLFGSLVFPILLLRTML